MQNVGFIGLGVMGKPMAKNLIKAGFSLVVHNRSRAPVDDVTRSANPQHDPDHQQHAQRCTEGEQPTSPTCRHAGGTRGDARRFPGTVADASRSPVRAWSVRITPSGTFGPLSIPVSLDWLL